MPLCNKITSDSQSNKNKINTLSSQYPKNCQTLLKTVQYIMPSFLKIYVHFIRHQFVIESAQSLRMESRTGW